jgi:magnesium transporter
MWSKINRQTSAPGTAPGIEHDEIISQPASSGQTLITCIDYSPTQVQAQAVDHLDEFIGHNRPEWAAVRWINVEGFADLQAIHALAAKYNLHPLAIEDVLHRVQRPKLETYGGEDSEIQARLFIVTRSLKLVEGRLQHTQTSIFLGHTTVLTFQEAHNAAWEAITQRIKTKGSRLRGNDASFLAYSLLDAIVDSCFPILDHYSERAEELEAHLLVHSHPEMINEIHTIKRDLLMLRWAIWPMREVVATMQREQHECVSDTTRIYLRDLYDHVIQIIEILETYREISSDLTDTYMSSVSNRMNEIMKVLTLIGTIFIPLTFLAGVYGMNFRYFPELNEVWAYPVFWLACVLVALLMLAWFKKRNWL